MAIARCYGIHTDNPCARLTPLADPGDAVFRLYHRLDDQYPRARRARRPARDDATGNDSVEQRFEQIEGVDRLRFVGLRSELDIEALRVAMQNKFDRAGVGRMRCEAQPPEVPNPLERDVRAIAMPIRPRIETGRRSFERQAELIV